MRLCRWLAYHACRARSLVRLVLVASIAVPPEQNWCQFGFPLKK